MIAHPYGEKEPGGLGRAIFEMVKGIISRDRVNFYTIYAKGTLAQKPNLPGNNWEFKTINSKFLWLTGALAIDPTFDLYIFFTPVVPLFLNPKKSIVVAMDFAYLDLPSKTIAYRLSSLVLYFLNARSFRLANQIVAISHETKRSMIRHFGTNEKKIKVIHMGFIPSSHIEKSTSTPEFFFFFTGILKPRKNISGIIRAFAMFLKNTRENYHLLIAGKGKGGAHHKYLVTLAEELGISDKVTFIGYVSDPELAYLYKKARAFVFPSFIEGFGMPILEAMEAGLSVITSNTGALAEVAGDAAILVNPDKPAEISEAMAKIVASDELRESLRNKGFKRIRQFTWEDTSRKFLAIIDQLKHDND